jgi:hypothetical protein
MTTLSTTSLNWLADNWEAAYSTAVLSGIVGDLAHKARGGYHISRQDQSTTNYSVTRPDDKPGNGPSDRAAAIDMTMSTADIIKCHTRLREIWKNRATDPRMKYINAWNGWDGQGDAGRYDVVTGSISFASPDHKWHIHLEIRRKYVNDMDAMRAILSMLLGESAQGDDDMTKEELLTFVRSAEGKAALSAAVWNTDGVVAAPAGSKNADGTANTYWGAGSYLQQIYNVSVNARNYAAEATNGVKAFSTKDLVDEAAIANALATNVAFISSFAAAVAEKLPTGVDITPEELAEAMKITLREGVIS